MTIPNQTAIQNNVDANTGGIDSETGERVSLIFNSLEAVEGQALVPGIPNHVTFAFNHASATSANWAADGVAVSSYSPTAGDVIQAAWIEIDTLFNGTTPHVDFGIFSGALGVFKELASAAILVSSADPALTDNTGLVKRQTAGLGSGTAGMPLTFSAADALKVVLSEDGSLGGTAAGASAGAAVLHLIVVPAGVAGAFSVPVGGETMSIPAFA